jgi:hypothetical protein
VGTLAGPKVIASLPFFKEVRIIKIPIESMITGAVPTANVLEERPGTSAEYTVVEVDLAIRVPSSVSYDEAAVLGVNSLTAAPQAPPTLFTFVLGSIMLPRRLRPSSRKKVSLASFALAPTPKKAFKPMSSQSSVAHGLVLEY